VNLQFGERYEKLGAEAADFCRESWPLTGAEAALPEREQAILWRKRALAAGWIHRTIPEAYGGAGREPDVMAETVIRSQLDSNGVPHRGSVQGTHMLVPTLLECGTEEQRRAYILPTLTGELTWCQGYSEPGSGSDLASLKTRAVRDGDFFVINGQKIWTTMAHMADWMFCLVRTDPTVPKHSGISFILFDLRSPGVTIKL